MRQALWLRLLRQRWLQPQVLLRSAARPCPPSERCGRRGPRRLLRSPPCAEEATAAGTTGVAAAAAEAAAEADRLAAFQVTDLTGLDGQAL